MIVNFKSKGSVSIVKPSNSGTILPGFNTKWFLLSSFNSPKKERTVETRCNPSINSQVPSELVATKIEGNGIPSKMDSIKSVCRCLSQRKARWYSGEMMISSSLYILMISPKDISTLSDLISCLYWEILSLISIQTPPKRLFSKLL